MHHGVALCALTDLSQFARMRLQELMSCAPGWQTLDPSHEYGRFDLSSRQDNSFDAVVCCPSVDESDMPWVVRECRRVLRSGGVFGMAICGPTMFQPLLSLYWTRLREYGFEHPHGSSLLATFAPEECRELLCGAGFAEADVRSEQHGYFLRHTVDWWDCLNRNFGAADVLNQLTPGDRDSFKSEHLGDIERLASQEGVWLDLAIVFAIARK